MDAFPLHWPAGWRRERVRTRARYRVTFAEARSHLLDQVRLLGGSNTVISSNMEVRRDGLPYASSRREPSDPGVAVYWTVGGKTHVMACDRWTKTIDNMRALGLALEALRALARSGASEILDRAFAGFTALPAPTSGAPRSWREVLGFHPADELVRRIDVEARFRSLARERHPDRGGTNEGMVELNLARDQAFEEIGGVS